MNFPKNKFKIVNLGKPIKLNKNYFPNFNIAISTLVSLREKPKPIPKSLIT
jgi:hypothetical protein